MRQCSIGVTYQGNREVESGRKHALVDEYNGGNLGMVHG